MKKYLLLLLASMFLSSCNDLRAPIEADDFGYPKVAIKAAGQNVTGEQDGQLSEWVSTGYKYNGDKLVVMVYNDPGDGTYSASWGGWFGSNEDSLSDTMRTYSPCDIATPVLGDISVKFNDTTQPPCIFTKGQGLYMLLTNPSSNIKDPNQLQSVNRNPGGALSKFYTQGLWQPISMYSQGSLANGYLGSFDNSSTYIGGHAYFKILDKYYEDNSGAFFVALKRGFDVMQTPPITYVINMVTGKAKDASKQIFLTITSNSEYLLALKAILTIYMMIAGILYTSGLMRMTQKELFFTFIRLIIVMQLLTAQSSWDFFNNYLFSFFTDGLNEILGIITSTIAAQVSHTTDGFTFFDNILGLLFSYETAMKMLALLISIPSGIVVLILLVISIAILTISIVQALVLYLLAYLAICILIVLGPIFITFMLFNITKSLFEGWINQLSGYFFQSILVFSSVAILSQVIINAIYKILGFRVCYQDYLSPTINGESFALLKAWQICSFSKKSVQADITVPGYGFWDSADPTRFCAPYDCVARRYIDLPFLDLVADADLISAFENPFIDLNVPMLYNSFVLALLCYLMFKFNDVIPEMAKEIAGGGSAHIGSIARSSTKDMRAFASGVMASQLVKDAKDFTYRRWLNIRGIDFDDDQRNRRERARIDKEFDSRMKNYKNAAQNYVKGVGDSIKGTSMYRGLKYIGAVDLVSGSINALKAGVKYSIPPLSMDLHSMEDEQNHAWSKKEKADYKSGENKNKFGYGVSATRDALVGALEDKFIGGVEGVGRSIRDLSWKKEHESQDDNSLNVSDVIKASSKYAVKSLSKNANIDKELEQARMEASVRRARQARQVDPAMARRDGVKSKVETANIYRENVAIIKALGLVDKDDLSKLKDPAEVNRLINTVPNENLIRIREMMGRIRRGEPE